MFKRQDSNVDSIHDANEPSALKKMNVDQSDGSMLRQIDAMS